MTRATLRGRTAVVVLVAWLALPAPSLRADVGAEPAAPRIAASQEVAARPADVTARVSRSVEGLEVEGRFRVAAPHSVVWAVLTDYDGIHRFVSSMRESRVTARRDDEVMVEQVAVGRLLLFKRQLRATLRVHEEAPGCIRFEDVLHKDFERYQGEWRIEDHGPEVEVTYRLSARPAGSIPDFLARGMFARTVRQLLNELQREIENRAVLAGRLSQEGGRP